MTEKPTKKVGRKLKLDTIPGLTKALCKLIREGMPIKYACDLVGLDQSTLNRYIERGSTRASPPSLGLGGRWLVGR